MPAHGDTRAGATGSRSIDGNRAKPQNWRSFPTIPLRSIPLANIKSAKKRAKQAVVRNARNGSQRSMMRTAIKKVIKALSA